MQIAAGKSSRARSTPAATGLEDVQAALRAARIEPVRVGMGYRLGLLLVANTMLLLPVIYLGIIVLVGRGVWWYSTHAAVMFDDRTMEHAGGRVIVFILVVYLAPIIAGAILVLFMIKPLFARRVRTHFPLSLSRADEPALYEFVDRLCRLVGAPPPLRIDVNTAVNAAAGFREGIGGALRKDLVLVIGLPLVADMELRELAGILAHEFGHFAQGTAMRLSFVVRTMNAWFARLVYERDEWDQWIAANSRSGHWMVMLVLGLARLCIWLSRRVLWALMWIGHAVSCLMLRQMEFDADRYETRVAGSETFARSCEKLGLLNVASQAAMNELQMAWRERRLCDDLSWLIRSREKEMPDELRAAVIKAATGGKTGWFDTHPAPAERIASAKAENAEGVFDVDAPATMLFKDFRELSRRATVAFYHQALGGVVQREHLVPTESLDEDRGKKRQQFESLRRYFQDLLHPIRPLFPERSAHLPKNPDATAELLLELRTKLMDAAEDARKAAKEFNESDERLMAVSRARALKSAGQSVPAKDYGFNKADETEIRAVYTASTRRRLEASTVLDSVLGDAASRLSIALTIEAAQRAKARPAQQPVREEDVYGEYDLAEPPLTGSGDKLLDAMTALRSASQAVESLRQHLAVLAALLSKLKREGNADSLVMDVLSASRRTVDDLTRVHVFLRSTPYPYEHHDKDVSLARYAIPAVPEHRAVGNVYEAADATPDAVYALYMRIMADLATRAEAVEASFGLPPLPEPKD
jgi:Zn-dependent protease with chaperone function